uniref:ATP synthase complex subunit 8 n=1 Tax=Cucujoidea sp. 18 KM-2017 TaxID=2219354 RepID=A0A346RH60_9CUCU|nr:ATP synthase F0 subunit 8 [Cucujoidea sp. 18 KM-2017]
MPQMAPLSWLTLFISFTLIFILFNSMNYFSFLYPIKKSSIIKNNIKINWKW